MSFWRDHGMINSWVDYGTTGDTAYGVPGFRTDDNGNLFNRGLIRLAIANNNSYPSHAYPEPPYWQYPFLPNTDSAHMFAAYTANGSPKWVAAGGTMNGSREGTERYDTNITNVPGAYMLLKDYPWLTLADIVIPCTNKWMSLTCLNSWYNYGNGWAGAGYHRDRSGCVFLRGLVRIDNFLRSDANATFQLPPGFRPNKRTILYGFGGNPYGAYNGDRRIDVDPDGYVYVNHYGTDLSLDHISLDQCHFMAADAAPPWVYPSLSSPWLTFSTNESVPPYTDNGHNPPSFFKDAGGTVHLRGLIKPTSTGGSNVGTAIFQLPPGHRPAQRNLHGCLAYGRYMDTAAWREYDAESGTWINYPASYSDDYCVSRVDITTDGWVYYIGGRLYNNIQFMSLDGIMFPAEQ